MTATKPKGPAEAHLLRAGAALLQDVDAVRGAIPRNRYICDVLRAHVRQVREGSKGVRPVTGTVATDTRTGVSRADAFRKAGR